MSHEHPARVDVVVVSHDNRETLRACVAPLAGVPGVTVTVVDNASSDGTLAAVADLPVTAIASPRNLGFGAGCNLGAARGAAPHLLLLNPDATLTPVALDRLCRALDGDPGVSLAGPRIVDGDGGLVHSVRRDQRAASTWARALFLHRLLPRARWANEIETRPEAYRAASDVEWVSGACMLVRRSAWERAGGFDERYFMYCEDEDLCRRLRAAGGRVRYEPSAVAFHEGGHSAPRASLYAALARSRVAYAQAHARRRGAVAQRAGLAVEAAGHALVALPRRRASARGHRDALVAVLRGPSS